MSELGIYEATARPLRRVRPTLVLLAAAAMLAGCESHEYAYRADPALTVEQRYPIAVDEEPVVLEVPIVPGGRELTSSQRADINSFLNDYRNRGSGNLEIRAPSGTKNEQAARGAVEEIRHLARTQGISPAAVNVHAYSGARHGSAYPPVVLGYRGLTATAPECGDWSENIVANPANRVYPNFGCASQKNLAAMIDNPRDLEIPRNMDAASSERRDVVREKYIAGEATATQTQDRNQGTVSTVGQ